MMKHAKTFPALLAFLLLSLPVHAEDNADMRELRGVVVGTSRHDTGTIVVVEKRGPTPRIYPRRDGEPKRRPL